MKLISRKVWVYSKTAGANKTKNEIDKDFQKIRLKPGRQLKKKLWTLMLHL